MSETLRELLLKVRYNATATQGLVTDALNELNRLGITEPTSTRYERQLGRARVNISDGWYRLTPQMLDIEFDLLGIAHTDRPALEEYARNCVRLNELAGPDNRARETSQVSHG